MHILLVSDLDPVNVIGGGERLLAGHATGLAARGHDVAVLSGAAGPESKHGSTRVLRIGRNLATPARAAAAMRSLRPDVVVGYQPASALGALRMARRRGIPTIYVFSSSWAEEYATRRTSPRRSGAVLRRAVERACLRASDRVVVLSAYSAERVHAAHPGVASHVRVVPGGVDPALFAPNGQPEDARRRLGLDPRGPLALTVRNLVPRMGLDNLLAAMPEVRRSIPAVRLMIAGDGPIRSELEAQVTRLGLGDRVLFAGFVPDGVLPEYYRAADLAVLPTRQLEGFGLMTVEALACGTPVVGTPVGATPEILGSLDPGLVLADSTPEAIAAGIVRFLEGHSADIRQRARRHVLARYCWDSVAARLEGVIEEVTR